MTFWSGRSIIRPCWPGCAACCGRSTHWGGLEPADAELDILGFSEAQSGFEVPGLIGLVTEHPETAMHLRSAVAPHSVDRFVILGRDDVFSDKLLPGEVPDVFVIETDLGGFGCGLRLMSGLLSRQITRNSAFCLLNGPATRVDAAMAFDLGANEQVDFQASPSEVAVRLHTLVRRKRDADRMRSTVQDGLRLAVIDPLTGLHNRRFGLAQLAAIAEQARADQTDFAVMVLDLDRFKSINDKWGHASGDAVLVEVARRLSSNLRVSDVLARIGGEEFLVALPATPPTEAHVIAERLCRAVEEVPITLANGAHVTVTISIGVAIADVGCIAQPHMRVGDLVENADRALMMSKTSGRNQVTISQNAA